MFISGNNETLTIQSLNWLSRNYVLIYYVTVCKMGRVNSLSKHVATYLPLTRQSQPKYHMQTALIWMRRVSSGSKLFHTQNKFSPHLRGTETLWKMKQTRYLVGENSICGLRVLDLTLTVLGNCKQWKSRSITFNEFIFSELFSFSLICCRQGRSCLTSDFLNFKLLCVSCPSAIEYSAILFLLFVRSSSYSPRSF